MTHERDEASYSSRRQEIDRQYPDLIRLAPANRFRVMRLLACGRHGPYRLGDEPVGSSMGIAMRALVLCGLLGLAQFAGGGALAQQPAIKTVDQTALKYTPFPAFKGIWVAQVSGTAAKPGSLYVVSVRYDHGAKSLPHTHPDQRIVTVLSGTFYAGDGQTFDEKAVHPLKPGSFLVIPANRVHYGWAKDGDVVLEEVGVGPSGLKLWPNAASAGK